MILKTKVIGESTGTGKLEEKINDFLKTIEVKNYVDIKLIAHEKSKFVQGGPGTLLVAIIIYKI
jgi:hypothetical protein